MAPTHASESLSPPSHGGTIQHTEFGFRLSILFVLSVAKTWDEWMEIKKLHGLQEIYWSYLSFQSHSDNNHPP